MRRNIFVLVLLLALPLSADNFAYVYNVGGDGISMSRGSLEQILRLKKQLRGTYIWARLDGRQYVIRDAASLAEAERAFAPYRAYEAKAQALRDRMEPVERRAERLERQIDFLADRDHDGDELSAAERDRLDEYRRQLRALRPELRKYEAEERELESHEPALDHAVDTAIERIVRRAVRQGLAERLR